MSGPEIPSLPELPCLFHCSAVPEISQILLYGICPGSFKIGILQFVEYLPVFSRKIILGVEPDIFSSGKSAISTLSGTKYIWLYTENNLPRKYRKIFNELKNSDLKTARAYSIKENLRNLWNCTTVEEAREFWKRWCAAHNHTRPVTEGVINGKI